MENYDLLNVSDRHCTAVIILHSPLFAFQCVSVFTLFSRYTLQ